MKQIKKTRMAIVKLFALYAQKQKMTIIMILLITIINYYYYQYIIINYHSFSKAFHCVFLFIFVGRFVTKNGKILFFLG